MSPQRTLARKADEFEKQGMQSLFPSGEQGGARESGLTLLQEIRQLVVDLHFELPSMSWREIVEVCYIRYGRRPHHKHVKRIATSGPPPSLQTRRYSLSLVQLDDCFESTHACHRGNLAVPWTASYCSASRGGSPGLSYREDPDQ